MSQVIENVHFTIVSTGCLNLRMDAVTHIVKESCLELMYAELLDKTKHTEQENLLSPMLVHRD